MPLGATMKNPSPVVLALLMLTAPLLALASPAATADLKDASGRSIGNATFSSISGGVQVQVKVTGLKPGAHGFHVHAAGLCEGPDFKSAAGHFNPEGKKHGLQNPQGHHHGDLPNLVVGADGSGQATVTLAQVTLGDGATSLFHEGGTSLVIHADADDGTTDPSGNSGARIACGVVQRAR
jgi:Cu-Zn family superoxide dismutase